MIGELGSDRERLDAREGPAQHEQIEGADREPGQGSGRDPSVARQRSGKDDAPESRDREMGWERGGDQGAGSIFPRT
jgi:hypothetical protein